MEGETLPDEFDAVVLGTGKLMNSDWLHGYCHHLSFCVLQSS